LRFFTEAFKVPKLGYHHQNLAVNSKCQDIVSPVEANLILFSELKPKKSISQDEICVTFKGIEERESKLFKRSTISKISGLKLGSGVSITRIKSHNLIEYLC